MAELIIVKTSETEKVKRFLQQEHINYEVYQETKNEWKKQEKNALQKWQSLSDEKLIDEWEKLSHNGWENN